MVASQEILAALNNVYLRILQVKKSWPEVLNVSFYFIFLMQLTDIF